MLQHLVLCVWPSCASYLYTVTNKAVNTAQLGLLNELNAFE